MMNGTWEHGEVIVLHFFTCAPSILCLLLPKAGMLFFLFFLEEIQTEFTMEECGDGTKLL